MKAIAKLTLGLALVPGVFLVQSTGTAAVVVFDVDRAVADTAEGKDAISKLNAFGLERKAAIDTKIKSATDLQDRLRTQARNLTDNARSQLERDLQAAQVEIETMETDARTRLTKMEEELLGPVEAKLIRAVNGYATERGVKIVLNSSVLRPGLVYVHDTADITTEIIRRIAVNLKIPAPSDASAPKTASSGWMQIRRPRNPWGDVDFRKPWSPGGPAAPDELAEE